MGIGYGCAHVLNWCVMKKQIHRILLALRSISQNNAVLQIAQQRLMHVCAMRLIQSAKRLFCGMLIIAWFSAIRNSAISMQFRMMRRSLAFLTTCWHRICNPMAALEQIHAMRMFRKLMKQRWRITAGSKSTNVAPRMAASSRSARTLPRSKNRKRNYAIPSVA